MTAHLWHTFRNSIAPIALHSNKLLKEPIILTLGDSIYFTNRAYIVTQQLFSYVLHLHSSNSKQLKPPLVYT